MAADVATSPHSYGKRLFDSYMAEDEELSTQSMLKRVRYESQQAIQNAVPSALPRTLLANAPKRLKYDRGDQEIGPVLQPSVTCSVVDFTQALEQQRLAFEKEVNQLRSRCEAVLVQKCEENRILKKGIAIQDAKIKELTAHCGELQQSLEQAVSIITDLEMRNTMLQEQLRYSEASSRSFNFHRPPDVF